MRSIPVEPGAPAAWPVSPTGSPAIATSAGRSRRIRRSETRLAEYRIAIVTPLNDVKRRIGSEETSQARRSPQNIAAGYRAPSRKVESDPTLPFSPKASLTLLFPHPSFPCSVSLGCYFHPPAFSRTVAWESAWSYGSSTEIVNR